MGQGGQVRGHQGGLNRADGFRNTRSANAPRCPAAGQTRTSSLGAARPLPPSADIGPGGQSVGQAAQFCLVVCWSSKDANDAVIARKFEADQSASGQLRGRVSAFLHKFCITECPAAPAAGFFAWIASAGCRRQRLDAGQHPLRINRRWATEYALFFPEIRMVPGALQSICSSLSPE